MEQNKEPKITATPSSAHNSWDLKEDGVLVGILEEPEERNGRLYFMPPVPRPDHPVRPNLPGLYEKLAEQNDEWKWNENEGWLSRKA